MDSKKKQSTFFRPLKNQKGMALLMAIFATTLMIFLAVEVSYDTSVEYLSATQQVNRLRAYYASKAGVEISLLRILIYQKAMSQFGDQLKGNTNMLDPIWQMPFAWPPILPDDLSSVDKELINSSVEESAMNGQFLATIESEGGKIDVNDLGSRVKTLRESTKKQLLLIFQSEMDNNREFADKHSGTNFEELINNMMDWVDEDEEGQNGGGSEKGPYSEYSADSTNLPPNSPFKTLKEIRLVAGMEDDLFDLLKTRVTVFGVKGIDVNHASKDVLMGLAPTMTEEAVAEVIKRRDNTEEGGPFKSDDDFFGFLQGQNVDIEPMKEAKLPLYYDAVYNFRIRSTGQFANVVREIEAVTYDLENMKDRYIEIVNKAAEAEGQTIGNSGDSGGSGDSNGSTGNSNNKNQKSTKNKMPKGRPTIVYWKEN